MISFEDEELLWHEPFTRYIEGCAVCILPCVVAQN